MITSEQSSDRGGCPAWVQPDRRRSISHTLARSTLIAGVAGAAFLSPIAGSVALAEASTNNAVSGVAADWRQPWEGRAGYSAASPVSSTATAAQSKGVVLSSERCIRAGSDTVAFDKLTEKDEALAYLPLAHIAERVLGIYNLIYRVGHATILADPSPASPVSLE